MAGEDHAPLAARRKIILLSDGTGNSSSKLFKTNVWRLYEALDLGPSSGPVAQIAYYDNGVGTSPFKPLALLGGIFGFGLKRNILALYRFLCRNYVPGSEISAFGFSRGAFTIRLLVALIGSQGIVDYTDERDLARQSMDAYREFCRANRPNVFPWGASVARFVRDILIWLWRKLFGIPPYRPGEPGQEIHFVGVWDTVAAYGGPIVEITRAIDDWLWPLTMTDYELGDHVRCARHALALDDERDAFQPLAWDEVHEHREVLRAEAMALQTEGDEQAKCYARARKYRTRLQQIWFAGMHADVGGGYPDESLSYVSLIWMIEEARREAGLKFLPDLTNPIYSLANSFGPMHDSREGLGAYYRYQPRKIEALLHPSAPGAHPMYETLNLRDPRTGERRHRPQGLLLSCNVHESVIRRIASGTDNYAPINLPQQFSIVRTPASAYTTAAPPPVSAAIRQALQTTAVERENLQETIWDWVWMRRLAYFATLVVTMVLATMPLWYESVPQASFESDGRWQLGVVIGWLAYVLPSFAGAWIEAFSARSVYFTLGAVMILIFMGWSTWLERGLRDRSRVLWWEAMRASPDLPGKPSSILRRIRTSRAYQWPLQFLKWRILPNLIGPLMIAAGLYVVAIVYTQAALAFHERGETFCRNDAVPWAGPDGANLRTDSPCNVMRTVKAGQTYHVTVEVLQPWSDGNIPAAPTGLDRSGIGWKSAILLKAWAPMRRVVSADYMQLLTEVRWAPKDGGLPKVNIDKLVLEPDRRHPSCFTGTFTPRHRGNLSLFVNDAVAPDLGPNARYPMTWFYDGRDRGGGVATDAANRGTARVTWVEDAGPGADGGSGAPGTADGVCPSSPPHG